MGVHGWLQAVLVSAVRRPVSLCRSPCRSRVCPYKKYWSLTSCGCSWSQAPATISKLIFQRRLVAASSCIRQAVSGHVCIGLPDAFGLQWLQYGACSHCVALTLSAAFTLCLALSL